MVFDRSFRYLEFVGNGLIVHPRITAHFEYPAALFGHPADDKPDEKLFFTGIVFLFERFVRQRFLDLNILFPINIGHLANRIESGVTRHAINISVERSDPPLKDVAPFPNLQKNVLRNVFRSALLLDDTADERADTGIISPEQLSESIQIGRASCRERV